MKYLLKKDQLSLLQGAIFKPDGNGNFVHGKYSYTQEEVDRMVKRDILQPCTIISAKTIEDKKWTDDDMARCWVVSKENPNADFNDYKKSRAFSDYLELAWIDGRNKEKEESDDKSPFEINKAFEILYTINGESKSIKYAVTSVTHQNHLRTARLVSFLTPKALPNEELTEVVIKFLDDNIK